MPLKLTYNSTSTEPVQHLSLSLSLLVDVQ